MAKIEMTRKEVKEFSKRYAKAMGVRFIGVNVLSYFLRLILKRIPNKYAKHVPKLKDKMRPHCLKNLIMLNFTPGDKTNWLHQILVFIHEVRHSRQIRKFVKDGGKVSGWYKQYFKKDEFRALQEGDANAAEAEGEFALTGRIPKVPNLESYYVGGIAQRLSDSTYRDHIEKVKELGRGSATFKSVRVALNILKEMKVLS